MGIKRYFEKYKELKLEYEEIKQEKSEYSKKSDFRVQCEKYAQAYTQRKVDSKKILYESFWGRGMVDNPYAIFKELLARDEYKEFQHIWVLDDFEDNRFVIEKYKKYPNVKFVQNGSDEYIDALLTAKYLFNNTTFKSYFTKKDDQIYINTWHGTPLKSMGYDVVGGKIAVSNVIRNFMCADYLISANDIMTQMYMKSYLLQEILPGEIIEAGYPRNDILCKSLNNEIEKLLNECGIILEKGKKVILYAPTWREQEGGKAVVNPDELLNIKAGIEKYIDKDKYQILIKPHQYVYQKLKDIEEYKGLLVPATLDANEVMSVVDILISDYSSIFIDYLVTGKPILFYIPDLMEYKATRGMNVDVDELPGPYSDQLEDISSYINNIEEVEKKYYVTYKAMRDRVCKYEDGNVTERIINTIFDKNGVCKKICSTRGKKRLLIYPGHLQENGITHSFLSLLNQIDYDEWDVTVYITLSNNKKEVEQKLETINPNVRIMVRNGSIVATSKEETIREFITRRGLYKKVWRTLYPDNVMEREYKRCFGMAEFDYIVDFYGYSVLNAPMFLHGNAKKKSIWLHNDMQADMNKIVNGVKKNYKYLFFNISLYPKYDNIVSCSKAVMEVNREKLGNKETESKFRYAKNTVNMNRIEKCLSDESGIVRIDGQEFLALSKADNLANNKNIRIVALPESKNINFVTIGRMSTEKNHIALLKAFSMFHKEYTNSKLYLIGDGPLHERISKTIQKLSLEDSVILTGNIDNPFAIMKRSDCFILPSIHEGQPVVLLEARACGLPIIVSDFSSVKDSLYPNGQLVIHTDVESIYQGLCAFAEGKVPTCEFDIEEYNREAYQEFLQAIQ